MSGLAVIVVVVVVVVVIALAGIAVAAEPSPPRRSAGPVRPGVRPHGRGQRQSSQGRA